mmetsp:Transcript_19939/g.29572  ORF Transcript_19939/g.29572 Transcript_19939/m.29572 type:complete len:114 (+) Transcript_19939:1253-1594(+)
MQLSLTLVSAQKTSMNLLSLATQLQFLNLLDRSNLTINSKSSSSLQDSEGWKLAVGIIVGRADGKGTVGRADGRADGYGIVGRADGYTTVGTVDGYTIVGTVDGYGRVGRADG